MGNFQITVNEPDWYVVPLDPVISTDCSTIYEYEIFADNLDSITFTLSGDHIQERYVDNGVLKVFTDTVTFPYDTSLILRFALENSGQSGIFSETILTIDNASFPYQYQETLVRQNDSEKCNTTSTGTPGSSVSEYKVISSNYTVLIEDEILEADTGGITFTLPTAVGNEGKRYIFKNTSGSDIFVDGNGSETIEGALILTIPTNYSYEIVSDNNNWLII